MNRISTVSTMTFDGGVECLDFINSGYENEKGEISERLHAYEDLLILVTRLQLFDDNTIQSLQEEAKSHKSEAGQTLQFARKSRELLYLLFAGIAEGRAGQLPEGELKELNELFAASLKFRTLTITDNKLQFSFKPESAGLMAPIWRFVFSGYKLLESSQLKYIRQCQNCAWLFLDQTKNHRKKWCSMESCGNRQKIKRYYLNKKKG